MGALDNRYVNITGDVMTGNLLMTSNKLIGGSTTTSDLYLQTTTGVGTTGADMHFLVGNNGATEAMTILNSGSVGIGTTSPNSILSLGSSAPVITVDTSDGADSKYLFLSGGGGTSDTRGAFIQLEGNEQASNPGDLILGAGNVAGGDIRFYTGGVADRMVILNSGNVGIGTTSPTAYLHLKASVASANGGAFKMTAGTLLTTPESGVISFDGSSFYMDI